MRKVKLFSTGEVVEVSNNEAFGLVDADKATYDVTMFVPKPHTGTEIPAQAPKNKKEKEKMNKERQLTRQFYKDRQMRAEDRLNKLK